MHSEIQKLRSFVALLLSSGDVSVIRKNHMNREEAVGELKKTFEVLNKDVTDVKEIAGDSFSSFHVRMSIRAYSALIEGMLYQMRHVALSSESKNCRVYNLHERFILSEEQCTLDKKGNIKTKESYEKALPMLLFTLKQYPKIHGTQFTPDTSDDGWRCLRAFISIRNRVVHPKSYNDLELTNKEWKEINKGIDWFYKTVKEMFAQCDKADEYYRNV
jgi:hypothetical protein